MCTITAGTYLKSDEDSLSEITGKIHSDSCPILPVDISAGINTTVPPGYRKATELGCNIIISTS
jgi:hypothetical protein